MAKPSSPTGYWAHYSDGRILPVVDFEENEDAGYAYARVCGLTGALMRASTRNGFIAVHPHSGE